MDSSHKTHLVNMASITSIMLYLMMCLPIIPANSETLPIYHTHNGGEFYVRIKVGRILRNLVFDTGSMLVWFQCNEDMLHYYDDLGKLLPWLDPGCPWEDWRFSRIGEWCAYDVSYEDDTWTTGVLAEQKFGAPAIALINVGCSTFATTLHPIHGILGMSRGRYSFISQISDQYGGRFSFCLVSDRDFLPMSYLRFGTESMIPSGVHVLKMLDGRVVPEFYDVHLDNIIVGQNRVHVDHGTFDGGCVLDTGTTITRLVAYAFDPLVELMDAFFRENGFNKYRNNETEMVCYYPIPDSEFDTISDTIEPLSVQLHFEGISGPVTMIWRRRQLFAPDENGKGKCLQILPSQTIFTTIGAFQMADIYFTFDLEGKRIYFIQSSSDYSTCQHYWLYWNFLFVSFFSVLPCCETDVWMNKFSFIISSMFYIFYLFNIYKAQSNLWYPKI